MSPQPTVRPAAPAVLARVDVVAASLGAQVSAARKRRRWTTQEVADRAGVSRALVYRVERGDQSTLETYVRLGRVLGLVSKRRWRIPERGHGRITQRTRTRRDRRDARRPPCGAGLAGDRRRALSALPVRGASRSRGHRSDRTRPPAPRGQDVDPQRRRARRVVEREAAVPGEGTRGAACDPGRVSLRDPRSHDRLDRGLPPRAPSPCGDVSDPRAGRPDRVRGVVGGRRSRVPGVRSRTSSCSIRSSGRGPCHGPGSRRSRRFDRGMPGIERR